MRSASAAEWVLSLVTPPDRAASTVGDLLEQSSARGVLWFWSSVLRTACSLFWSDLCSGAPKIMRGWPARAVVGWLFAALAVTVWSHAGVFGLPRWACVSIEIPMCTIVPFVVGWMLACRCGAQVFSAVVLIAAWRSLVFYLSTSPMVRNGPRPEYAFGALCATGLFAAAGAILFRRRAINGATHA